MEFVLATKIVDKMIRLLSVRHVFSEIIHIFLFFHLHIRTHKYIYIHTKKKHIDVYLLSKLPFQLLILYHLTSFTLFSCLDLDFS